MATIGGQAVTLLDYAKREDPDGKGIANIIELLSQTNEMLMDIPWLESNQATGHLTTIRTGLPDAYWRKLNAGIPASKSTTAQVMEACGLLESLGKIDVAIAEQNGNTNAFRLSENMPRIESLNQTMQEALLYGDHTANPAQFLGLSPRYSTISGAINGQNIINAAGNSTDNTSVWLIGWGENSVHGIYPKGTKAGIEHIASPADYVTDADGHEYLAYRDHFKWRCGMVVKDWRYAVRIANIDVSNLVGETSAADLIKLMSRAISRLPSLNGVKPAFYCNRTISEMLRIQGLNKSQNALSVEDALGQITTKFLGIPIRTVDQVMNTEAAIS